MRKEPLSGSGLFSPRVLVAFTLCAAGVGLTMLSFAANPPAWTAGSADKSSHDSLLFDEQTSPLNGHKKAEAISVPLAPTPADGWSIVTSPNTSATQNNLLSSVACASGSDCWAVGYYYSNGDFYQTLAEHWNGTSWTIVTPPNPSSLTSVLYGVACASVSECWAVGYYDTGSAFLTLIEHWDGTSWTIASAPNTSSKNSVLNGVTCISTSQCWAVGYSAGSSAFQTLVEEWNGTTWAIVGSPSTSATQNNYFYGVTCASASDCWAIGYYFNFSTYQTLIERWNGSSWAIVASLNGSTTQDNYLHSVTCTSTSNCWAIGYYSNGSAFLTLIEHWDGTSWTIVTSPNPSSTSNALNGVTCASTSQCWAVGYYAASSSGQTLVEEWSGTSWVIVGSPNTSAMQNNSLSGLTCPSAAACWAVGYYNNGSVYQTLIEEYTLLKILSITRITNSDVRLQCFGVANAINRIEASPDLSPGSFSTLSSIAVDSTGAFQFDDGLPGTKRFYRLAYP